jgi:uncharacterized protein YgiM (DUF1202 family)
MANSMNTPCVLAGLLILFLNTALGAVRLRRTQAHAGWFSVTLALIACALIGLGIARAAFSSPAASYGAALLNGSLSLSAMPPILIAGGGLLISSAALGLFYVEAHQPAFDPGRSAGLLHVGGGLLTLVAALIIPLIAFEFAARPPQAAFSPTGIPASPVRLARKAPTPRLTPPLFDSPTPEAMPRPFDTSTPLPSLTPTPSETPIVLYTLIPYTSTYAVGITSRCTITAVTALNLRGDPSVERAAIGRVFAGSLLNVTGRSADKKWWRVIYLSGGVPITGWVSGEYVSADSACDAVPVVDSAGGLLAPTGTPTPTSAAAGGITVTPAPCTLITTAAVNLRPDPSRTHAPIATIPAKTVFGALQRSADRQWWQVAYGSQAGWISADAVIASAACAGVLPATPTP